MRIVVIPPTVQEEGPAFADAAVRIDAPSPTNAGTRSTSIDMVGDQLAIANAIAMPRVNLVPVDATIRVQPTTESTRRRVIRAIYFAYSGGVIASLFVMTNLRVGCSFLAINWILQIIIYLAWTFTKSLKKKLWTILSALNYSVLLSYLVIIAQGTRSTYIETPAGTLTSMGHFLFSVLI